MAPTAHRDWGTTMLDHLDAPTVPLPKHWCGHVRSVVLHVTAFARLAAAQVRGWAANSLNRRLYLAAQLDQARQETALLREELRIKGARMTAIPTHRRPHYPPTERMAKHIICDKGPQFWCDAFKKWCKRRSICPRFGAVGKHGSSLLRTHTGRPIGILWQSVAT